MGRLRGKRFEGLQGRRVFDAIFRLVDIHRRAYRFVLSMRWTFRRKIKRRLFVFLTIQDSSSPASARRRRRHSCSCWTPSHDVFFSFVAVSRSLWRCCWLADDDVAVSASATAVEQQPERSELGDIDGHKQNHKALSATSRGQAGFQADGQRQRQRKRKREREPLELPPECGRR